MSRSPDWWEFPNPSDLFPRTLAADVRWRDALISAVCGRKPRGPLPVMSFVADGTAYDALVDTCRV